VLAWQRAFGGTPLHLEATRDGKDLGRALQAIAPGIVIVYVAATGDKFVRAQPPAAAWNAGRIRVPSDARTMRQTTDADLASFVRVVTNFSGMGGEDDDADALAHAWGAANAPAVRSDASPRLAPIVRAENF
jgi:phage terminase large subunit-like protein